MTTTANALIIKSMQKAGILTMNQQPTANEANDVLDAMNDLMASWSNDSMMCIARSWETFPLTANTGEYTMGPGGDFDTVHPISLIDAQVNLGGTDYDVEIVNDEIYASQIRLKTAPGQPQWLNSDNAWPLTKLRFWPVPSAPYTFNVQSEKVLEQFALGDEVDLPPGWNRMIIYNTAVEIGPEFGVEVPASVQNIAVLSKRLVKKAILKNRSLDAYPKQPNPDNIFSGWNR